MNTRFLPLIALSLLPLQAQDAPASTTPEAAVAPATAEATPAGNSPLLSDPAYRSDDARLEGYLEGLKREAAQGKPEAARRLAENYLTGNHFTQARAWAQKYLDLLRAKAENGDVPSMLTLGGMYWQGGQYTPPDREEANRWFRMAADHGDVRASYILGEAYRESGQRDKSREAFAQAYRTYSDRASRDPQDLEALYWQGFMELKGEGTAANAATGLDKLNRAADAGSQWALTSLFKAYTDGDGVPADKAKAMEYARRLVDSTGDGTMAYMLACYHMNLDGTARPGEGVDEHNPDATKYLDIAAKANNPSAICHKADILRRDGKLAESLSYYRQAASMAQPQALTAAAEILLKGGEGIEQDTDLALRYLQVAVARYQDGDACRMLADFYREQGETELANHWIVQASDANCAAAMAKRGLLHLSPFSGLTWDPTLTYQWWIKGRELGDSTCQLYLNLYFFVFIPLLLILVFGLPLYLARRVIKQRGNQQETTEV